ncbi:MAG: phospholipase A [Bacteroides sp.]|nr:phospholipase A [Bacteroides sp.]
MKRLIACLAVIAALCGATLPGRAQILGADYEAIADSLKTDYDIGPFFGLYKDNYFTVGTSTIHKPSRTNSDVKFQISLAIRLTKMSLPWKTYLYLFYSQKTLWNVFEDSMPMRDLNFNPGIGWSKPFFSKGRYIGKMTLIVEHESNGRDGLDSRSWNKVSLAGSAMITDEFMVHAKYWIPIVDGQNNRDILDYTGLFQWGFQATSPNHRWALGFTMVKRRGWNMNWNTITELTWNVSPKTNLNLFAQYYNGYGENLLDYNQFHSRLRVGLVFKPRLFSDY